MRPNYRRETKDLMKAVQIAPAQFCTIFKISDSTYRNWVSGNSGPQTKEKFEQLKQFATYGRINDMDSLDGKPPDKEKISILEGHINQLTIQISLLTKDQGAMNLKMEQLIQRLAGSEKKISNLEADFTAHANASPTHEMGDSSSRKAAG